MSIYPIEHSPDDFPQSRDFDDMIALLGLEDDGSIATLRRRTTHLARHYNFWKVAFSERQLAGPSREALRDAETGITEVLASLEKIDLETEMLLDHQCRADGGPENGLVHYRKALREFGAACREAVKKRPVRSGRQERHALHNTVGALTGLIQALTDRLPVVRQKRGGEYDPELVSNEARAIGRFFAIVDKGVSTATLVNMIKRILDEHPDGVIDETNFDLFAIFETGRRSRLEGVPTSIAEK